MNKKIKYENSMKTKSKEEKLLYLKIYFTLKFTNFGNICYFLINLQ